jgi:hypothetical protein
VDHAQLMIKQRAEVVLFDETKSVIAMQRKFWAIFQTHWAPAWNTILCLNHKFKQEGTVKEEK